MLIIIVYSSISLTAGYRPTVHVVCGINYDLAHLRSATLTMSATCLAMMPLLCSVSTSNQKLC